MTLRGGGGGGPRLNTTLIFKKIVSPKSCYSTHNMLSVYWSGTILFAAREFSNLFLVNRLELKLKQKYTVATGIQIIVSA